MNRGIACLAALSVAVWLAAPNRTTSAQWPAYPSNPYTGRGPAVPPVYNPYTGASPERAAAANPYTGRDGGPPPANPYTGFAPADYNPYTNRFGSRLQSRAAPGSWQRDVPITGKVGPGLEDFDAAMLRVLERHGVPGAALALAKDGKLVLARGYGWADLQTGEPVRPDMLFGLASLSKSITAATVLKLVEQGKLSLDDQAFRLLAHLRPLPGVTVDPRIYQITVRHLLNHSGGWDRAKSGEPSLLSYQISRRFRVPLPIRPDQLIRLMLAQPLDFDPGTDNKYSNYGYIVLGEIIERVTGRPYAAHVRQNTLEPMGIRRARLPGPGRFYGPDEVRRYHQGTDQLMPPRYVPPMADAAGGWTASAVDLVRFLTALDGSRGDRFLSGDTLARMLAAPVPPLQPRPGGSYFGLGWDVVQKLPAGTGYWKDGLLPGSRTFMGRTPSGDNWVVLFNSGEAVSAGELEKEFDPCHEIRKHVHKARAWPDVDYSPDFRD